MKPRFLLTTAVALALSTAGALAHAFLEHAEPAVGSKCAAAPTEVRIAFTEKLEGAFSSITVTDSGGKRVDKGDSHLAGDNRARLCVSLAALKPGTYRVEWRAVSVDTHVTKGGFSFEVTP